MPPSAPADAQPTGGARSEWRVARSGGTDAAPSPAPRAAATARAQRAPFLAPPLPRLSHTTSPARTLRTFPPSRLSPTPRLEVDGVSPRFGTDF